MAIIVHLEDHTGNRQFNAKLADEAPVRQLLPELIRALQLPVMDSAGRAITWRLSHSGRQLQGNETLASAAVQEMDTLTLVPEMTAATSAGTQMAPVARQGKPADLARQNVPVPSFAG